MDSADEVLEELAAHPDAAVTIGAGTEHWERGATTLTVHGDGRTEVHNRAHGEERELEGRLDPTRVAELGRELVRLGLTSLRPHPGDRLPGDVPVWVAVERAGETLHEAKLWHGDRYRDPELDSMLRSYQRLVEELTDGELPFGG
jgi:hypothetical protein